MKRNSGFTILELLVAFVLVIIIGALVIAQKNDLDASNRDQIRKTSVNAIYYGLKEGYYKDNKSYPTSINAEKLPYINPNSFTPVGKDKAYNIHYIGLQCDNDACQDFLIKVRLEKEADYKRSSTD